MPDQTPADVITETFIVVKLGTKKMRLFDLPVGVIADIARQHSDDLARAILLEDQPAWWLVVNQPLKHDIGVAISVLHAVANELAEPLPNPFTLDAVVECFDVEPGDLPPMPPPPEGGGDEEEPGPTHGGSTSTAG